MYIEGQINELNEAKKVNGANDSHEMNYGNTTASEWSE